MGEKQLTPLLKPDDVALLLDCSDRTAREVMMSLNHVRIGKLLRIRREVLEKWMSAGGTLPCRRIDYGSEVKPGGAGDTMHAENDGKLPRSSETRKPRNSPPATSSGVTRLIPITGHGRGSRSKGR